MSTTYAQRQIPAQKKDAPTAASVLDASSQSESLQRKADMANNAAQRAEAPRPNNTGMPDNLKSGIESLSGFSMDDVRVHYNSSKPATVQALAYTQGTDIHVAPGQEKHLPHEAWHVAQQMAGRVSPTTNINGMPVNDNAALEHEADVMGEKAVLQKSLPKNRKINANIVSEVKQLFNLKIMGGYVINSVKTPDGQTLLALKNKLRSYLSTCPIPNKEHYNRLLSLPDVFNSVELGDSVTSEETFFDAIAKSKRYIQKEPTGVDSNIKCMFTAMGTKAIPWDGKKTSGCFYSNADSESIDHNFLFNTKRAAEDAAFRQAATYTTGYVKVSDTFLNIDTPVLHLCIYRNSTPDSYFGFGSVLHGPEYIWVTKSKKCCYPIHYHPVVQPLRKDGENYVADGDYRELENGHYFVVNTDKNGQLKSLS